MSPNKLLLLTYDFPPSTGGIARLCYEIVKGSHNKYSEITVLAPNAEYVVDTYEDLKCNIIRLPKLRILREFFVIIYLLKIKHKSNYNVLCGLWHPEALLAIISGFKNIFILGHGTEFLSGISKFKANFWLPIYCKWVLSRVKKIITNSNYTLGLVNKINRRAIVEALPLAVNEVYFKPIKQKKSNNKIKISTVSRVFKYKGHDFIFKTLLNLPLEIQKQFEWHIAGTGPYLDELKKMVNNSNIANQVFIHGFVFDHELVQFYNNSDVFILATREDLTSTQVEGFGLVFLEAQACGVPVIGTNTGGITDAVKHNDGGWLINQDSYVELSELLTKFVRNRDILMMQSKRARSRVLENCTYQTYCINLFNLMS